jgi:hypothetical protein
MVRRSSALLLMAVLVTVLLPAGEGATRCPRCGKLGRCCCLVRSVPTPGAHCARNGDQAACAMKRPVADPTGMRAVQVLPDRTGAVRDLVPMPPLVLSGRVAAAGSSLPTPFQLSPPTPPPRDLRLV